MLLPAEDLEMEFETWLMAGNGSTARFFAAQGKAENICMQPFFRGA